MDDKEQAIMTKFAKIFPLIPADKQEYFLGYAEAVADMAAQQSSQQAN